MSACEARTSRMTEGAPAFGAAEAGASISPATTARPVAAGARTFIRVLMAPPRSGLLAERHPVAARFAVGVPNSSRPDCHGLALLLRHVGDPPTARRVVRRRDDSRVALAGHHDDGRRDRARRRPRP